MKSKVRRKDACSVDYERQPTTTAGLLSQCSTQPDTCEMGSSNFKFFHTRNLCIHKVYLKTRSSHLRICSGSIIIFSCFGGTDGNVASLCNNVFIVITHKVRGNTLLNLNHTFLYSSAILKFVVKIYAGNQYENLFSIQIPWTYKGTESSNVDLKYFMKVFT